MYTSTKKMCVQVVQQTEKQYKPTALKCILQVVDFQYDPTSIGQAL